MTDLTRRLHEPVAPRRGDPRLPEVNLYFGNDCNRDCDFCCVEGRPGGTFEPFRDDAAAALMRILLPEGRVKLYGGEPTLHEEHLIDLVRDLRSLGYEGRWTIFSNGIRARTLIRMLESDPPGDTSEGSDAYLNYRIWNGIGVEPIPPGRRTILTDWAKLHPGRIWLSHEDVLEVGAAEDGEAPAAPGAARPGRTELVAGECARCWPTVRSDGRVHACAFAVEVESEQYALGDVGDDPARIGERHAAFIEWIDRELEPAARAAGEPACTTCLRRARQGEQWVHLTTDRRITAD